MSERPQPARPITPPMTRRASSPELHDPPGDGPAGTTHSSAHRKDDQPRHEQGHPAHAWSPDAEGGFGYVVSTLTAASFVVCCWWKTRSAGTQYARWTPSSYSKM